MLESTWMMSDISNILNDLAFKSARAGLAGTFVSNQLLNMLCNMAEHDMAEAMSLEVYARRLDDIIGSDYEERLSLHRLVSDMYKKLLDAYGPMELEDFARRMRDHRVVID